MSDISPGIPPPMLEAEKRDVLASMSKLIVAVDELAASADILQAARNCLSISELKELIDRTERHMFDSSVVLEHTKAAIDRYLAEAAA